MIKETEVIVKIVNGRSVPIYSKLLGRQIQLGEELTLPVCQLSKGSHQQITAICEGCGAEKQMQFKTYYHVTKGLSLPYLCPKHTAQRAKEKWQRELGVDNIFQVEEIKEKSRQTSIQKYGVPYHTQTEDFKQAYLYGDKNYFYRHGGKETLERYDNNVELKRWRLGIYRKHNCTCVICGKKRSEGATIEAHHEWGYFDFPEKRYDPDNGVTLCGYHHHLFHWLYRNKIITPGLLKEYIEGLTTIPQGSTTEDE